MKKSFFCKKKRFLWLCLLALTAAFFITGTVFAEGELPVDETADSVVETQGESEEEMAAETQEAVPQESTEENPVDELEGSGDADQSGEDIGGEGEAPADEFPVDDYEGIDESEESVPAEEEVAEDDAAEQQEDDGMSSDEEIGEGSESEDIVPEDEVTLVDEDGNPIDMASQESADLISGSDPYWSVSGVYYSVVEDEGDCYAGTSVAAGTCWVSTTPIRTALNKIEEGRLPTDGNLYVESGTYTETDLDFNGTYLSQMRGLIGAGSWNTTIIGDITLNVTKGFTLSGFTILGGVKVENSIGALTFYDLNITSEHSDGLYVGGTDGINSIPHPSPITIFGVNINDNTYCGAFIDSVSTVKITNASFSGNTSTGLQVSTTSVVTLDGITANGNTGSGIRVYNFKSLTAKNIIANDNEYDHPEYPDGYGLYANSSGKSKVTLDNIQTNNNRLSGVYISAGGTVSVKNLIANGNEENGLVIYTDGSIKVDTVEAYANLLDGVYVATASKVSLYGIRAAENGSNGLVVKPLIIGYYDEISEEWVITAVLYPSGVTLSSSKYGGSANANSFGYNGENGVWIESKGTVTISNLDAYSNGIYGLLVNNYLLNEETELPLGRGNVTINVTIPNWKNGFWENGSEGVLVMSNGTVSIDMSSANDNAGHGFYVNTTGVIKFMGSDANGNGKSGAYLSNQAATRAKSVSVSDSFFNGNNDTGLVVLSLGTISMNGSGSFENYSPTMGGPLAMPVTIRDFMYSSDGSENWGFYGSTGDQLDIILISNDFDAVVTIYNSAETWSITDDNSYGGNNAQIITGLPEDDWYRIEVTYTGSFEGQGDYTLRVNDENEDNIFYPGSGAVLDNSAGTGSVTISTTKSNTENHFDGNAGMGIHIKTFGSTTIKNLNAMDNYRSGLLMMTGNSKGKVTFTDKYQASNIVNNREGGVGIATMGNVNLLGLNISGNGGEGLLILNIPFDDPTLTTGSVTLSKVSVDHSGNFGIIVFSNGNITLSSVVSTENAETGIYLQNNDVYVRNVTLKNVIAGMNNGTGITINTLGKVTLSEVDAYENNKTYGSLNPGAAVSEYYNADAGPDRWWFEGTASSMLQFYLSASDNGDWDPNNYLGKLELFDENGTQISFDLVFGEGTNAFTATWTPSEDGFYYVEVSEQSETDGFYRFSINNPGFENMNYFFVSGLNIDAGSTVSLSGKNTSHFTNNSLTGMWVTTPGNISLKNVYVGGNGTEGAYLDNYLDAAGTGSITISGLNSKTYSRFNDNGWEGIVITTNGAVSLKYVGALMNGSVGIDVWGESKFTGSYINVSANNNEGLLVDCIGTVVLSNVIGLWNGQNAVDIATDGDVKVTGSNYLSENGGDGIMIDAGANVTLMGMDVRHNGGTGINVVTEAPGKIYLKKVYVLESGLNGINLTSYAASTITILDVTSFNNGNGSNGDGLSISCFDPENSLIVIKKSVFMGNEGRGIETYSYGPVFVEQVFDFNSLVFYGNDTNNDGEGNIANYRY